MQVTEIDVTVAKTLLDDGSATFVDIRDSGSFAAGRVPGAEHLGDANIEEFVKETDRQRTLVVYCYHGFTSIQGAAFLQQHGFSDVRSLSGGFEAWRSSNDVESD